MGINSRTIILAPRAYPQRRLLNPDCLAHSTDELQRKARPILDRPAIIVGALVRNVLQELINEVAIRAVQLDAVKASTVNRLHSRLNVKVDCVIDV